MAAATYSLDRRLLWKTRCDVLFFLLTSKQWLAPQCTNGVRGRLGAPVWFTQLGAGGWGGRHHAALRLWVHLVTCEGVKIQVTHPPCHLLQPQSLICFWLHLVSAHHLLTFLALMSELTPCSQNSKVLVPKPALLQTGLKGSPSHLTRLPHFLAVCCGGDVQTSTWVSGGPF